MLIDTCCEIQQPDVSLYKYDFCNVMKQKDVKNVVLFRADSNGGLREYVVQDKKNLESVIKRAGDTLAIKYYLLPGKGGYQEMREDLANDKVVGKLYGNTPEYLTSLTTLECEGFVFNGILVTIRDTSHYYYLSVRCQKTLNQLEDVTKVEFERIIVQLLESFRILHNKGYYHGDVKLQNIMYCRSGKGKIVYKLIDWGRLHRIEHFETDYMYGGSTQMGSPLCFYFMFRNLMLNKLGVTLSPEKAMKLAIRLLEGKLPLRPVKSPLLIEFKAEFMPIWEEVKTSFRNITASLGNDEKLFDKYKYTLDLYNVGLVALYLVLKHKLPQDRYMPWIKRMIIYDKNMISSATEAMNAFREVIEPRSVAEDAVSASHGAMQKILTGYIRRQAKDFDRIVEVYHIMRMNRNLVSSSTVTALLIALKDLKREKRNRRVVKRMMDDVRNRFEY
jgi:serine/threonine protein kinase